MNRKQASAMLLVLVVLISDPRYLPLVASQKSRNDEGPSTITGYYSVNGTLVRLDDIVIQQRRKVPSVSLSASKTEGVSPLPIRFRCEISHAERASGVLQYLWDFDGDGLSDKVTYDDEKVIHVYETKKIKCFNASVTIGFVDGTYKSSKIELKISPVDYSEWNEIKELGQSKLGINKNGTIIVYDESSWLPITFKESSNKLREHRFIRLSNKASKLSYPLNNGHFNITINYGISGRKIYEWIKIIDICG